MLKVAASITLVFAVAACSGPPKPGTPEYALQQHEFQVEKTKTAADEAPDWYINPPKDERYIYAAGSATSTDLQFAVDKAILNAKYQLADQLNGKVSGKHKDFITETAGGQLSGTAERATSNVVADIALPAYQVTQRKVVPVDTQFRSYVLLQFAVAHSDIPQQQASAAPAPSPVSLQKQAEAAHRELQSDVATAKEQNAALTPTAPKPVIAFPIGMPPPPAAAEPPPPAAAPHPAVEGDTL